MHYGTDAVQEALQADGLASAEQITGKSYKEDIETQLLGIELHMRNCEARERILSSNGDTTFSMTTESYIAVIERMGFGRVYREDFIGDTCGQITDESLFVYFRHPAQPLVFDTYHGDRNSGHVYYNWRPRNLSYPHSITSTSSWWLSEIATDAHNERNARLFSLEYGSDDYKRIDAESRAAFEAEIISGDAVLIGSHDCREAMAFNLGQLAEYGQFVEPWVEDPFLWLLHWGDTKVPGYDHKAINGQRLAKLPADIRAALGIKEDRP